MIKVTPATREHIELLASWQVAMALESEGMPLDLPTVVKGVTRVFDEPQIGYYLIATQNENSAGCCLVLREWSDWRNGFVLWIHSVYTHPAHRGRGVFKAIYNHLKLGVQSSPDLRGLRLYVERANKPAINTYNALGMNAEHYHLYEWMKDF